MNDLRTAAQQALEALQWISDCHVGDDDDAGECASCHERSYKPHAPDCKKNNAITALRAALTQEQAEPLTIERLRDALVASRIIPPAAVEDPDEYDDGVTLHRIEALHRRIT